MAIAVLPLVEIREILDNPGKALGDVLGHADQR
jgi:hypothetical protein